MRSRDLALPRPGCWINLDATAGRVMATIRLNDDTSFCLLKASCILQHASIEICNDLNAACGLPMRDRLWIGAAVFDLLPGEAKLALDFLAAAREDLKGAAPSSAEVPHA